MIANTSIALCQLACVGRPHAAPTVTLLVRAFSKTLTEIVDNLFPSFMVFWDASSYMPARWTVVLDTEERNGLRVDPFFLRLRKHVLKPRILYEPLPDNHTHIFPGRMRNIGYDRQQWSFFYSDLYCARNETDVIAFFDSDVTFLTPVLYEDLFEGIRPRLIGLGLDASPYAEFLHGTSIATSLLPPGHFMMNFPVMVKYAHFAAFRKHVERVHALPFDLAFARIVNSKDVLWNKVDYCQFDWMATYLWHFHRSEVRG